MKLIITGGHLTPALSLIDYAGKMGDEIIFIGRRHRDVHHQVESREKAEIESRRCTFISLDTIKIERHRPWMILITFPRLCIAFAKALKIIREHKPDVVVSFGGYVAVPVALAAFFHRVPIITHEQTQAMGLANQIIAHLAYRIAVSWEDTAGYVPAAKKVLTGNPLRAEIRIDNPRPDFVSSEKPIIYITGGNQGSAVINRVIFDLIPALVHDFYCIHQTGNQPDFDTGNQVRQTLPPLDQAHYTLRTWYSAAEVGWILSHAHIVIGRSGANTVAEIMAKAVPSIFIPLPVAAYDEQTKNAQLVVDAQAGLLVRQEHLTAESLTSAIKQSQKDYAKLKAHSLTLAKLTHLAPEIKLYSLIKDAHEPDHH